MDMENNSMDLSKIISLIMENPKLISDIKALSEGSASKKEAESEAVTDSREALSESVTTSVESRQENQQDGIGESGRNRKKLLSAFKPYLSDDRKRAVDSIVSIVDIIDAMKAR